MSETTNVELVRKLARSVVEEELRKQVAAGGGLSQSVAAGIAVVIEERLADAINLLTPHTAETKAMLRRRINAVTDALDTFAHGGVVGKIHTSPQDTTCVVRALLGEPIAPSDVED